MSTASQTDVARPVMLTVPIDIVRDNIQKVQGMHLKSLNHLICACV